MVIRIPWWVVGVIGSTLSLMCPWVMVLVKPDLAQFFWWLGCIAGNVLTVAGANGIASEARKQHE
jgi:hypothetical protein